MALAAGEQQPVTVPEMWTAWCARCHGEDGSGKVAEPTITVTPMDFTDCRVATAEPDVDWERAIAHGGPAVGLSSEMPGFADSLTPPQIRAFVSHMRGFCTERGWPSGNANFPRPLVTGKAFPENEFVIVPAISHYAEENAPSITEGMFKAIYERRIGRRSMIEIGIPLVTTNSLIDRTSGLGDVSLELTHAIYNAGPRIVSAGLELSTPTGDRFKDHGKGTTVFEPFVTAGNMIRGWYLQTELKAEFPVDLLRADKALIYNAYVGRDLSAAPSTWTLGMELNGESAFPWDAPSSNFVALTPQVRKGLTGTGALAASAGVMLPLNRREEQGVRWVGYLLWEYLEPFRARR